MMLPEKFNLETVYGRTFSENVNSLPMHLPSRHIVQRQPRDLAC